MSSALAARRTRFPAIASAEVGAERGDETRTTRPLSADRSEVSVSQKLVEAGGIEPKSAAAHAVSCCGHGEATCGQNTSDRGQVSGLATSADGELRTEPGHLAASCGHPLALKWPQSVDADLGRVIESWPRLSDSQRDRILSVLRTASCVLRRIDDPAKIERWDSNMATGPE